MRHPWRVAAVVLTLYVAALAAWCWVLYRIARWTWRRRLYFGHHHRGART